MLKLGFVLALGTVTAPEMSLMTPPLAAQPPIVSPNPFLESSGGSVSVVTITEPQGFGEAIRRIDQEQVIDAVWQAEKIDRETGRNADVFVVFVDDWTDAQRFATGIRSARLAEHYAALKTEISVDLFTARAASGRYVQWITIARNLSPYRIPPSCYARLVVSVIYSAGNPGDIGMRACAKQRG
ncbi:MAG: hypothetical protein KDK24_17460 [Pseudooceanicola sp.]|nr:hypothetical protein [Pseudooceanicola sp.]